MELVRRVAMGLAQDEAMGLAHSMAIDRAPIFPHPELVEGQGKIGWQGDSVGR